jgi:putative transposase
MAQVRVAFTASGGTYGAPRIERELRAEGLATSRRRVTRLMRAEGLVARPAPRRRVGTTDSWHAEPIAPNPVQRQFERSGVAVNRVWVGDITYLPTREGFLYLAAVLE